MKARSLLMLAGLSIAAWLAFFGDRSPGSAPDTDLAQPLARPPGGPALAVSARPVVEGASAAFDRAASRTAQKQPEPQILALQRRSEMIGGGSSGNGGARLFSVKSWAPPPAKASAEPPPPPSAPSLPFTYLGRQAAGGRVEVYLARGDTVFVVREQTVIEGTYRVDSIKPPTLSLTYLPLNQIQQLSIGIAD